MGLELAAALLASGKLTNEVAIAAAISALDEGLDSESLRLVFYETPGSSGTIRLFAAALSELGIPVPPRDEASLTIARVYARQILDGRVTPYEGARRIWWELANEPGAGPSLRVFVGLASEWEDAPRHRPEYEAEIMSAAQELANGEAPTRSGTAPPVAGGYERQE